MSNRIAIDPEARADPFYRYQMRLPELLYERRGNRTAVFELQRLAHDLGRPPEALLRHVRHTLGTRTQELAGHHVVNGEVSEDQLLATLDVFIDELVLCGTCRCPETAVQAKKKRMWLACKACGEHTPVRSELRAARYLHTHALSK